MRIAYLLKKFPRLSETFVLNEILGQERLGADVHVFSRRAADDEPRHPQLSELRAPVEVLPERHELDAWTMLFADEPHPEETFAHVGRLVQLAREWEEPRFARLLAEALYLLRRTRELGIDHLHTHFATDSATVAMMLHELGGPSYSITAHAKDIYRSTVDVRKLDRLFARAAFVVTVCDANARHLAQRIAPEAQARVRRLYNGIDLEAFDMAPSEQREEYHVLSVGRLVEKKGFSVLLDALAELKRRNTRVQATIVGDGDEREALERRVVELGLSDSVVLAGAWDQARVREIMNRATVFCLPCLIGEDGNRDALPTVLLEALAVGLPVVSTPVTGIPEIVADGRAGELVPERDARATADALERLLGDGDRRRELARRGRERAQELFCARRVAATLNAWFEEVSSQGAGRVRSGHGGREQEASCGSPA